MTEMTSEEYIQRLDNIMDRIDRIDLSKSTLSIEEKTSLVNKLDEITTQLEKLTFDD